jgi:membrane protease subunit (stomatin/prohibitin family)
MSEINKQLRSIIEWENPNNEMLFFKWTERGDEIKNASKLIVGPGQGCLFVYEGKIEGSFDKEGKYNLQTENIPFWTTIKNVMFNFESQHKVGIYYYRQAEMLNRRWGTPSPITYSDPVFKFPVGLGAFGNFSFKIIQPEQFFRNVVAGANTYTIREIQTVMLSRITQPISNYLANAQWGYTEIDKHRTDIANFAFENVKEIFKDLGFQLLDFRIEGTSFDEDTRKRIGKISDMSAEAQGIQALGIDYAQYQHLQAMRDMAKNEGGGNVGMQFGLGMKMAEMMGQQINPPATHAQAVPQSTPAAPSSDDPMARLEKLKKMFDLGLINDDEYKQKKAEILSKM